MTPVKKDKVKVDDIEIYFELYGHGTPLVLIAGTGMSCATWRVFQVAEFSKQYQVLIYDHRGLGRTDKPDIVYTTRLFAKDCAGLMAALGIQKAHVMGHSMGGRVAQWVALDFPQKVRSLVLSGTGSGKYRDDLDYTRGVPLGACVEMIEKGYEQYMRDHWEGRFMFTEEFAREHPEIVKRFQETVLADLPPLKFYLRHVVARQGHETTELLGQIKAPTLVICGSEDTVGGGTSSHVESSRVLAEKIPNAEFVLVPGGAHGYLREMPEKGHPPIIDFLRRH